MVKGFTTAASLRAVVAIGLAVGGSLSAASGATMAVVVGILAGVTPLAGRGHARMPAQGLCLVVRRGSPFLERPHAAIGVIAGQIR